MRIVIVDDHPLVRMGLSSALHSQKKFSDIIEASNVKQAIEKIANNKPEVAIIDLKLENECGLEILTKAKKVSPDTKYMILTAYISREEFLEAELLGVDGYVLKDALFEDIIYAINAIVRGKKYYDPGIIDYKNNAREDKLIEKLTDREKDVLKELGKGSSNDEIAQILFISENTVKKHVSNIMYKLDVKHRAQIAALLNENIKLVS